MNKQTGEPGASPHTDDGLNLFRRGTLVLCNPTAHYISVPKPTKMGILTASRVLLTQRLLKDKEVSLKSAEHVSFKKKQSQNALQQADYNMHHWSRNLGSVRLYFCIILFSKDTLIKSDGKYICNDAKHFSITKILYHFIFYTNFCAFEISIHQRILKNNILGSTKILSSHNYFCW